jgi:two-component system CheB/CheR fusion protein
MQVLQPLERRVTKHDGDVHYLMRMAPYRTADNKVDGALLTFVDVSSVVKAEEVGHVLLGELNERVHDVLGLAIELASRAMHDSPVPVAFTALYQRRIDALRRACALIETDAWTGLQLREVMVQVLAANAGERFSNASLDGPAIVLSPRGVLAVGIIGHDLARQSMEGGALSVASGRIQVTWRIEETAAGDALTWDWRESGGVADAPPLDRSLVQLCVEHELQGKATFAGEPDEQRVTLTVKLRSVGARPSA